jgi:Tol biopolymer transport system component
MTGGARGSALVLSLAAASLATASASSPGWKARVAPLVVWQVPATAAAARADGTLAPGLGERGRLVVVSPDGKRRVLTASFHSAADPEVSFDGGSILFAAKREEADPWCIYEMEATGAAARKISCGAAGARQPVYLPTIYTITPTSVEPWAQVAFVGEDPGEWNEARIGPNTSLWSCKLDGTVLRRLTYNLSNDRDPVVLPDGRIVYAAWLRAPGGGSDRVALLGINADGTDYQAYAGGQGLRVKQTPTPTADGLVVFVETDRIGGDGAGRLASLRQVRPRHSYRSLSAETDGLFRAPSALPDGSVLVAWRPSDDLRPFAIWAFDPATGAREQVFSEPGWHSIGAKLLSPRPAPDARSSVVRDDDPEGKLYTVDVGIQSPGDAPSTRAARRLRVVEGVPATADRAVVRRLLGELKVADDGSYQVQIPANTPVQLELLAGDGSPLRTSTWLWVRNHAAQGCVGCHEDPERVPPNRLMKALAAKAPVLHPPVEERRVLEPREAR